MYLMLGCPRFGGIAGMTWYVPAQVMLQLFGFFAIAVCGAAYESLPGIMAFALPFPKFVRFQHWLFMGGVALLVVPLAIGGVQQGLKLQNPGVSFADITQGALMYLRVSTLGVVLLLLGSLMFAANIFLMTLKWKLALLKCVLTVVKSPLETEEVKS
jgi:cbb3-type cytochrome oxidase subunit 1